MYPPTPVLGLLSIAVFPWMTLAGNAPPKEVVPMLVTWSGSVADEKLLGDAPAVMIGRPDDWKETWQSWKLPGDPPEVDFERCLVLVQTSRGGRLRMKVHVDDQGDASIQATATRDLRPGFRYMATVVLRAGIKTVGGKEPPRIEAQ